MRYLSSVIASLVFVVAANAQVATSIPYGVRLPIVDFSFNTYLSDPGLPVKDGAAVMFRDAAGVWRMRAYMKQIPAIKTDAEYTSNANWNYAIGASLQMTKASGGNEWPMTIIVFRRDK